METAKKKELEALAVRIRMAALEAIHSLGSGHLGGTLSICDALAVLYGGEMRIDVSNPKWPLEQTSLSRSGHLGLLTSMRISPP